MKKIFTAVLIFFLIPVSISAGTNWYVTSDGTGDAPTIAAAIDSASSGDIILVYGGNYYEEGLIVDGKDISITAYYGTPVMLAPTPGSGTAITFRNVSSSQQFYGFKLVGYENAVIYDNASPSAWFLEIRECVTGLVVTGSASSPDISGSFIDSCGTALSVVDALSVSFHNNTVVYEDVGVNMQAGSATIEKNIFYNCNSAVECLGGSVTNDCNDFWLNGTDYSGCSAGPGDIFADPIFCFLSPPSPGLYYPHEDSPCLAENNSCGVNIGAFPKGCIVAVEESSWSEIKSMYK